MWSFVLHIEIRSDLRELMLEVSDILIPVCARDCGTVRIRTSSISSISAEILSSSG